MIHVSTGAPPKQAVQGGRSAQSLRSLACSPLSASIVGQRSAEGEGAPAATTFTSPCGVGLRAPDTVTGGAAAEARGPLRGHAGAASPFGAA
jgi:hypothetical protein